MKSELDLFAVPPTQTSIDDGRWVEHQHLTSLDSGVQLNSCCREQEMSASILSTPTCSFELRLFEESVPTSLENGGNAGLAERRKYIAESRVVDMMGRLHVDLFLQDRFLLNGVSIKIRLVRSKDTFSLMADGVKPGLHGTDSGRHPVRAQGCVEPDCSDGSHKSIGKWNGQVSATTRGLQCLHHTARCHVAHVREPLPRDATETTHLVVCRQQCLQWRLL